MVWRISNHDYRIGKSDLGDCHAPALVPNVVRDPASACNDTGKREKAIRDRITRDGERDQEYCG